VLERKEKGTSDPLLELIGQAGRVGQKNLSQLHDAYLAARKLKKNL
jgi:hypothetical protein